MLLHHLARDVLVEILGFLAPSDVILSSRPVCQRLYQISKERSVWLNILARCDYVLPCINVSHTSTHDLERILLRAEMVKSVWTGERPPLRNGPEPSADLGANLERYVGFMENYVVAVKSIHPIERWSWYAMDSLREDRRRTQARVPDFTFSPDIDPTYQTILSSASGFAIDTGVFYVAYLVKEILPEGEEIWLKIVSVTVLPGPDFKLKLELIHHLEPGAFSPAATPSDGHYPLGIDAGHGYIAVYCQFVAPLRPIHIFDLKSGRLTLCPWWRDENITKANYEHTIIQFTPWHQLIQIRPDNVLEFFRFPPPLELLEDDGQPPQAHKTNTFELPAGLGRVTIIPRSPTSCVAFLSNWTFGLTISDLRLLEVDLSRSTVLPRCIHWVPTPDETEFWVSRAYFTDTPDPQSALAVGIYGLPPRHAAVGIWISLSPQWTVTVVELEADIYDVPLKFDLDPFSGRVIRFTNEIRYDHLMARDYVVRRPPV